MYKKLIKMFKNENNKVNVGFHEVSGFYKSMKIRFIKGGFSPRFWFYRLRWNLYPKLHIVPKFPLHLLIEVTNRCNLKCIHCPHRSMELKRNSLDFEYVKQIIDEAASYNLPSIMLSYAGEVLLHKDAIGIFDYASLKKSFLEISIVTNATLMTPEKAEAILNSGITQIIISVDALSKEKYEYIRKGAKYEKTMSNINYLLNRKKELMKKKPLVRIQMVGMNINKDEIEDFKKYWKPKVDMVTINDYYRPENSKEDFSIDSKYSQRKSTKKWTHSCSQLWQRLAISANKEVLLCNNELIIGEKGTKTIFELWHSKKLNSIREKHKNNLLDTIEHCSDCGFRYI